MAETSQRISEMHSWKAKELSVMAEWENFPAGSNYLKARGRGKKCKKGGVGFFFVQCSSVSFLFSLLTFHPPLCLFFL